MIKSSLALIIGIYDTCYMNEYSMLINFYKKIRLKIFILTSNQWRHVANN